MTDDAKETVNGLYIPKKCIFCVFKQYRLYLNIDNIPEGMSHVAVLFFLVIYCYTFVH